jgi:hypothetical protein
MIQLTKSEKGGERVEAGDGQGEMTQTMYVHVNK